MIERIIKKIKSLPPLPESVMKVREICDDPDGTIKDLIQVVKQDPMFTADILKIANSPLYGFSRQITTIDQAVSLFGMGTIQGFAVSYAMRKNFTIDMSAYGVSSNTLLEVSTMQNALTNSWGKSQVSIYQAEMVTLSLLMELGKMVAAIVLKEDNKTEMFKKAISSAKTFDDIISIEKEFLSISSEWIGALMFKHWKFNDTMINIMQHTIDPEKADDSIKKHTQILRVVKEVFPLKSPLCNESINAALERSKEYNLDFESLNRAIKSIQI